MSSNFWRRYWHAQFSYGIGERAAYFAKAAAAIYLIREHIVELTVVSQRTTYKSIAVQLQILSIHQKITLLLL